MIPSLYDPSHTKGKRTRQEACHSAMRHQVDKQGAGQVEKPNDFAHLHHATLADPPSPSKFRASREVSSRLFHSGKSDEHKRVVACVLSTQHVGILTSTFDALGSLHFAGSCMLGFWLGSARVGRVDR